MEQNTLTAMIENRADEINAARYEELDRRIWGLIHEYGGGFTQTKKAEDLPPPFVLTDEFFSEAKKYLKEKYIHDTLSTIIRKGEDFLS